MRNCRQGMFGAFRIDTTNELLCRGSEIVPLRPKTFALLKYLAQHPGQLVTKKELLETLWPDSHVCDYVLKQGVLEIRKALGDHGKIHKFVETAHCRGYRFVGKISEWGVGEANEKGQKAEAGNNSQLVGRQPELAQMQAWFERALRGEREIVFITGEQGIGKTSLLDKFVGTVHQQAQNEIRLPHCKPGSHLLVARGQCLESHGGSEAYMPVLGALTRLCHSVNGSLLLAVLRRCAPLWLMQMPSLITAAELEKLQRSTSNATHERMLREMAEALETLTAAIPLVLVLEDLHWSDYSTLDLISFLARGRSPARLFLVGTYRPEEVIANNHPLRMLQQELHMHRQCQQLQLPSLGEEAIGEYLMARFPGHPFSNEVRSWIWQRTEGNPLFVVSVIDHLIAQGLIGHHGSHRTLSIALEMAKIGMPATIRQMIEQQIERCDPEEQRVLEAGSVEELEFSAAAVAAVLDKEVEEVEALCEGLVRRHQFLQHPCTGRLSDEPLTARYRFIHSLYRNVCHNRLTETQHAHLHLRVGEYMQNNHLHNLAALHFKQGQRHDRAAKYYRKREENANRRNAEHEEGLASRGLELLK
jgi:DNA-binding winged helix-turn-helix (wHTH) protein